MLISNPFANPDFPGTVRLVAAILGGALPLLVAGTRFNLRGLLGNVLFQRWLVWACIAPVYGLAVFAGPLPTALLAGLMCVQGLREYSALVGLSEGYRRVLLLAGVLAPAVALLGLEGFYWLPPLLLVGATLQPIIFGLVPNSVRQFAFSVLGWAYIAWLLTHLLLIDRYINGGQGVLLAVGLGVALSDVGAFAAGKLFGRHKLAPRLSPKKTWEGVVGNFAGAYLGVALISFVLPEGPRLLLTFLLPPVIAVGAVWGDLLESSIKREFGAKDAGSWLPGFGGLLDRIDSLIIVAPLVYYLMRAVG